ncbi:hypothetical protein [Bradyrhizobium sp. 1200_D9_N1_1]|uniref:hypothetical protein n=1 Tax=Bradyrhizobium sp. 1200_D9_N1_1 TaxID=3239013 RepID=UPI003F89645C
MSLPRTPAAPRAPAVIRRLPALERELADLKLLLAERVLAATEGAPGARERLVALVSDIRALEAAVEANGLAHELAQRLDREAVAEWRLQVEADPVAATEGITKKACCGMCSEAHGCVITRGEQCAHPVTVGGVGPRRQGDPVSRKLFQTAAAHLKIAGYEQEDAA